MTLFLMIALPCLAVFLAVTALFWVLNERMNSKAETLESEKRDATTVLASRPVKVPTYY